MDTILTLTQKDASTFLGAETEISSHDVSWLDSVNNVVIELHGDECREIFFEIRGPLDHQRYHSRRINVLHI